MSGASSAPALAIELSTRAGTVALRCASGSVGEEPLAPGAAHASDLLPAIERLARRLGEPAFAARPSPRTIVVGLGPGSFTGLRVAVASALGLARASGAELVGLPSSDAWFAAALEPGERGALVLDARAEQAYLARAARDERGALVPLEPPSAHRWPELAAHLAALRDEHTLGRLYTDLGSATRLGEGFAPSEPFGAPSATALLALGLAQLASHGPTAADQLRPLYLMPSTPRASR